MAESDNITGRDRYIIAKALHLAIQYIDQLPPQERPLRDKADMHRILEVQFPDWQDTLAAIDAHKPKPPPEDDLV